MVQHKSIYANITKLQLKCAAIITFCHKSSENLLVCKPKVYIIPPRPPQGREPDMLGRQLPALHCPPGSPSSPSPPSYPRFPPVLTAWQSAAPAFAAFRPAVCRILRGKGRPSAGQGGGFRRRPRPVLHHRRTARHYRRTTAKNTAFRFRVSAKSIIFANRILSKSQ